MAGSSSFPPLGERLRAVLDPLPAAASGAAGHAAVLLALTDEPEPRLWLIRRSYHLLLHGGQIAFPGGKGEPTDRDLLHTALREAEEEVALPATAVVPCGVLTARRTLTGYDVMPVVGIVSATQELVGDPAEVAALLRLPLAVFADTGNLFVDRVWRGGNTRVIPRYQVGPHMIWGMTASFIVELVNRFYGAGLDAALHAPPPFSAAERAAVFSGESR